ncbi:MAG: Wzz/FepE/Etk N-terminal domain-containing protein [Terracidiphilus sp.]|jgi:polysaccharide chain length determinant protein (PEP-CTERM system associated)
MLGHRELTMQDYVEMLKRRLVLVLTSAVILLGIGLGISYTLPPEYVSKTFVLIEQQKVSEDYVKPVVNEDLGARLASMREQILSRSRIEPIIERFDLYGGNKYTMDDRVDMTRKAIGIDPIPAGPSSRGMPGFNITFKARDAHTAQQVCGEITSLFISANLSAREESAEGTTEFLKQQLADSKRDLDEQEAKLADFERKNIGKLPDQEAGNLNTLQALSNQLDATTQSVNRMQQDETMLEAMVAQQAPESTQADPAKGTSEDSLDTQLKDAINKQKELEALYTPDHPDIIKIKRRVANLRAEIARDQAESANVEPTKTDQSATNSHDSPQLRQLKTQLRTQKQSLEAARLEQARLEKQVRAYEARIEASPLIEEEYKQVTRDHETALQFYHTLLAKMNDSSMATALEHRQQGEQFHVMDAPNLPDTPTFPSHTKFAAGGLAAGLGLGLLIALLLEYRDRSLRNESDIWAFTKLPTLAVVSYIDGLDHLSAASARGKLASFIAKSKESVRR